MYTSRASLPIAVWPLHDIVITNIAGVWPTKGGLGGVVFCPIVVQ